MKLSLLAAVLFISAAAAAQNTTPASNSSTAADRPYKFEMNGDLRYRYNQSQEDPNDTRRIQQIRARLGLKAEVNDSTKAVIRFATGTTGISANQTVGNPPGSARRAFDLDLAYIDWKFLEDADFMLGRTPNVFWSPYKTQTIFDADLTFEGAAASYKMKFGESNLIVNAGAFEVSENFLPPGKDQVDIFLLGLDLGYAGQMGDSKITVHAGTYQFPGIEGRKTTMVDSTAGSEGNSSYKVGTDAFYAESYSLANAGAEMRFSGLPLEPGLFAEYVRNLAASDLADAMEAGVFFKWGDLTVQVAHIDKRADSVVGAFTDSDTSGGGTDNRGQRLKIDYQLGKNVNVAVTQFIAKRGIENGNDENFKSTFADVNVQF
jgi:hypothetical protein